MMKAILVGAALLALALLTYLSSTPSEPARPDVLACFAAQMAVKERLSGSARFPSCLDAAGVTAEGTTNDGAPLYLVRSRFEKTDPSGIYRTHAYRVYVRHDRQGYRTIIAAIE
jgi:hypothetical protein